MKYKLDIDSLKNNLNRHSGNDTLRVGKLLVLSDELRNNRVIEAMNYAEMQLNYPLN
jgi:hypothetical protein